ncbi:MAG: lipoyl(octanoyl) transferase LipB [Acidobacteriota bacterium]|nr:lipoyl(octanoyl) transferase LipB [Acidobacteriota bacterium]
MRTCSVHRLHLVTYENGMTLQQKLVELRQREEIDDQLLLLEHPPVITLGRGGKLDNLLASPQALQSSGIRFFETTRGGDITYHGPGQIVGYPILHLGEGKRDVRKYVTNLEEVLIRTVAEYGITAARIEGRRGIWVGDDKIAAIGVRIARWVTSHGWALNVSTNLEHFRLITPCGLHGTGVTSIERELGRAVPVEEVREILAAKFAEMFERELVPRPESIRLVKVILHDRDRVLLLHRRPERGDFWQPVSGTIEDGESAIATARRELVEETGHAAEPTSLDLTQSFLIESQYLASRYPSPIIASEIVFHAALDSRLPIRIDTREHDAWGWFPLAEALEKIRWTDDREALERLPIAILSPASRETGSHPQSTSPLPD